MIFFKLLRGHLILLILLTLILLGYLIKDSKETDNEINKKPIEFRELMIDKVIDGDTFESNGSRFRLLGINTPEKREYLYNEAKNFLKKFEGNSSRFEVYGLDKYNRTLGYLSFKGLLINKEIISEGLASSYYYGDDAHKDEILKAETKAMSKEIGIWKKSADKCGRCIIIKDVHNGAEEDDCKSGVEFIKLNNQCSMDCDVSGWLIKDSSSAHAHKFGNIIMAPQSVMILFNGRGKDSPSDGRFFFNNNKDSRGCYNVWNDAGDSAFLRDDEGLLVDFYRY